MKRKLENYLQKNTITSVSKKRKLNNNNILYIYIINIYNQIKSNT